MLEWFLTVNTLLREMRKKALDCQKHLNAGEDATAEIIKEYLVADYKVLSEAWEKAGFDKREFGSLGRHIGYAQKNDLADILQRDLPAVEALAERHARQSIPNPTRIGFEDLLHPIVLEHGFQHYKNGHWRDAVLNSIVAVFDLIRERTGVRLDGQALVTKVLSIEKPHLVFSELNTESGQNDQKGFMQILIGVFIGIRNPKAHTLVHDLDEHKAAQYMILASLIARRVSEATVITQ